MGQRFRQGFKNNREVHFLKRGNIVVLVDSCSVYFPWYQAPKSKIGSGCPVELYLQMGCRRLFKDKKKKIYPENQTAHDIHHIRGKTANKFDPDCFVTK
jgi:hypothetical protein